MTPIVKNIILACVAVFLVQQLIAPNLDPYLMGLLPQNYQMAIQQGYYTSLTPLFGLVPFLVVDNLFIWQFASYIFLHGDLWHILFNMYAVWLFGKSLESTWGSKEFLRYFFITGVGAGFTIFIWNYLVVGTPYIPTIGASGAVFGILTAYALFFPDQVIYLQFFIPVKAKYLALIFGLLEFMMLPGNSNVSHIGHLGGMLVGFFYLRNRYRHWGIGRNLFKNPFKKKGPF